MSKDELLSRNKYFYCLTRIINFEASDSQRFLKYILKEAVQTSLSTSGFLFQLNTVENLLNLSFSEGRDENDDTFIESLTGLLEVRILNNTDNPKAPVIINESTLSMADRICIIPVTSANSLKAVVVLVNDSVDYSIDEAESIRTILNLSWKILDIYLKLEEMARLKELAVENERQKNNFLINISHEIKTPVNAIVGFSNLLAESEHKEETRKKFLDIILNSSDELLTTVNDFSEISNLEHNLSRTSKQEINVKVLFGDLYDQFVIKADAKKVKFSLKLDLRKNEHVFITDGNKLNQILTSLLNNAFRFTYNGEIELSVRRIKGFLEFKISDTGMGIPERERENIFKYYKPYENSMVKRSEGVAGLSVSKAYVRHMGGEIWFASVEGEGSDFYFTLPFAQNPGAFLNMSVKPDSDIHTDNTEKVILVAEDDDNNYFLIENILRTRKFTILHALNGREAVEICRTNRVDLVLMDINMPVMDGYSAAKLILESDTHQKIIAQTAYSADRDYAIKQGCIDFIAKPFGKQQLLSLINSYI